jgi:protein-disulfide isomerase
MVSFTLSAKSLFFGGFVLGLIVMAIPATFFATRAAPLSLGGIGNGDSATIPAAPSVPSPGDPSAARPAGPVKPISKEDHVRGDDKAPITLIEYSDLECPFCKRFHPTVLQLMNEYKGKVKWVYRHFPLSFHANAQKEAEATECAASLGGTDAYWKYVDTIFERTTSNGTGFALDQLAPLAKEIGLDEKKFKECLDGGKMAQRVQNDFDEGQSAGVDGTPGNILLGKDGSSVIVPGAVPYETLKSQVDQMLAKK